MASKHGLGRGLGALLSPSEPEPPAVAGGTTKLPGPEKIPAVIREATDAESLELALIENLLREDLNPIEEAEAYQKLLAQFAWTQEELAERVGKDRRGIAT